MLIWICRSAMSRVPGYAWLSVATGWTRRPPPSTATESPSDRISRGRPGSGASAFSPDPAWPDRSLPIWVGRSGPSRSGLAGPVPPDLGWPVRSHPLWVGRSGPSRSGLAGPVPPDLGWPVRSLPIWVGRSGPSRSGLLDAVRDSRARRRVTLGGALAAIPPGNGTSPLPAGRPRRGVTDQAAEVLTALPPPD